MLQLNSCWITVEREWERWLHDFLFYALTRHDCQFVDLIAQMWSMQPALFWFDFIFIPHSKLACGVF